MTCMTDISTINALRLLQAADAFKDRLSGGLAAIHGLSVNEYFLLLHLGRAPEQRLPRVELAKRMNLSASTVTRMVAPMEKIGLVDRLVGERDARLALVVLTNAGATKLADAEQTFGQNARAVFADRWQDAELETLAALLHRLVADSPANLT